MRFTHLHSVTIMKNTLATLLLAGILLPASAQTNPELAGLIKQSFAYFPKIQELEKATEISDIQTSIARSGHWPVVSGQYFAAS